MVRKRWSPVLGRHDIQHEVGEVSVNDVFYCETEALRHTEPKYLWWWGELGVVDGYIKSNSCKKILKNYWNRACRCTCTLWKVKKSIKYWEAVQRWPCYLNMNLHHAVILALFKNTELKQGSGQIAWITFLAR